MVVEVCPDLRILLFNNVEMTDSETLNVIYVVDCVPGMARSMPGLTPLLYNFAPSIVRTGL